MVCFSFSQFLATFWCLVCYWYRFTVSFNVLCVIFSSHNELLHCALASCGAVYCNRSCLWPFCGFVTAGGLAGGVRTLLQPARAQCLRLSERFFHYCERPTPMALAFRQSSIDTFANVSVLFVSSVVVNTWCDWSLSGVVHVDSVWDGAVRQS